MHQPTVSKTIKINNAFTCQNCGHTNPPAVKTCRNHCRQCLYSLHVDKDFPGDRQSNCLSLMEPLALDQNSKKGFIIVHQCLKCKKTIPNKVADDDQSETLIKITKRQNLC